LLRQARALKGYDRAVTTAGEQTVRSASATDVKPLAAVMARAFYDDPPFTWMLPDPKTRLKRLGRFFAVEARAAALAHGGVDVALVGDEVIGGAIWRPPGHWGTEQLRTVLGLVRALGPRIRAAAALSQAMARAHPREPHWYLFAIGVDPARQGSGVAGALIRPRLGQCDHDGLPAYLEASKPTSVPLYQHFGFEPTGILNLPDGAPPLTAMWRPTAASATPPST
jgi:GNAT superfamily N-acetyltransferase